jgi:formylaminopyrimidine deformylase
LYQNESIDMRELVDYVKVMVGFIADWCNQAEPECESKRRDQAAERAE